MLMCMLLPYYRVALVNTKTFACIFLASWMAPSGHQAVCKRINALTTSASCLTAELWQLLGQLTFSILFSHCQMLRTVRHQLRTLCSAEHPFRPSCRQCNGRHAWRRQQAHAPLFALAAELFWPFLRNCTRTGVEISETLES